MPKEWTILQLIQWTTEYLERKSVESPRLNAEHLIAHSLKISRMDLYLQFERRMTEQNLAEVKGLIQRRASREPLQYILGTQPFRNINVFVNKDVLIPRPETEIVVQQAIEQIDKIVCDGANENAIEILDLCTGSGVIAAAIASEKQEVRITATDASRTALQTAEKNIEPFRDRITLLHGDLFEPVNAKKFDIIISNPPYISNVEFEQLQPEVKEFEPREALTAGEDGLDFYRRIVNDSPKHLKQGGKLILEVGDGRLEGLKELFQNCSVIQVEQDLNQKPRVLTWTNS